MMMLKRCCAGVTILILLLSLSHAAHAQAALASHEKASPTIKSLYEAGQEALASGNLAKAGRMFRSVLARDPDSAGAHANLGVIEMRQKHWREALVELKTAERLAPAVAGVRLNIGLVYYRQGRYNEAIEPFASVVRDEPQSQQARFLLGICYFLTERYPEALGALKPLWPEESNNLSYLYLVSVASDKTGDRAAEDQAAAQLLRAGGNSPAVHLLIGKADLARRANDAAMTELESAVKADPRLPFAHFYLGIAYRRFDKFALAKQAFEQDLAIDPHVAYTYDELGTVCSYLQQDAQAVENFREALRLDPRLPSSWYGLAKIETREKRYHEALADLGHAGEFDPHSASVHYLRGQILLGLGQKTEARSEFQIAAHMHQSVRDELLREITGAKLPNPEFQIHPR